MTLSQNEKKQLRHDLGLYTTREAARLTGHSERDYNRAICLGILNLQQTGDGKRLVSGGDIHAITHDPGLLQSPKTAQGWFDSSDCVSIARLAAMDVRNWNKPYAGSKSNKTILQSALIHEARLAARYARPKSARPFRSADEIYALSPDEFRRLKDKVRAKLESITVKVAGEERKLSRLVPRFSQHIDRALQEAF